MNFRKYTSALTRFTVSSAKACIHQAARFKYPLLILALVSISTTYICSSYLTLDIDFNQAYDVVVQQPPTKENSEGLSIKLNGLDGGKAIIGFRPPNFKHENGNVRIEEKEKSSENLILSPKKSDEIQAKLSELNPQKWQVLTNLPSPIFKYNLNIYSDPRSPNNAKISSYYLIRNSKGVDVKLIPGQQIQLGSHLRIDEISREIALTNISLVYEHGIYMNFYDRDGKLISQATGTIIINPTLLTIISVFVGIWVVLLGLLKLLKETLLLPNDVKQIKDRYKQK